MAGLIQCQKVIVQNSPIAGAGAGAFAACDIKAGDLVECGIVRRISIDGNECPYVFTWSDEVPSKVWAIGSGCSTFYNTGEKDECNVSMKRYYDEDRFEIFATKDIKAGEELRHVYKSRDWRKVFQPLSPTVKN